jgi:Tfp pilus assembly protein PilE
MLLRVFLILAILAGIGTVAVTQFMVRPHIQTIMTERDTNKQNWDRELARANKVTKELKTTQETLVATEKNLEDTKNQLAGMTAKATQQETRANNLQRDLETTTQQRNEAQQDLAAWKALGIPVDAVKQVIESERRFREANAVLNEEKKILLTQNRKLNDTINELRGNEDRPIPMPGVKGTVVAVDPKWNFVVLDVGEKAGAKQKGIFMVARQGKLIGKVKVATVQPDRSIANIMPGWQLEEIMEGDQVIHQF